MFQTAQVYGSYDRDDDQLGKTGWNYFNGDGVLMYPGTDTRFTEDSYGVSVPFASLRLKHWRRGVQDHDYLTLASQIDPEGVDEIVNEMIPKVLWEVGCAQDEESYDESWVYSDISWSNDPDVWEAARAELADIIEGGTIDTDEDGLDDRADTDDDNDEMPDLWEFENYFDHLYAGDASSDADNDGVTNLQEYLSGTDPREQIEEPETEPGPEPEPEPEPDTTVNGNIIVQVMDEDHAPLSGVTVYSTSQPAGQSSLNSLTDSEGSVAFYGLKPGSYTLKAMMSEYEVSTISGGLESDETIELTFYLTEEPVEEGEPERKGIPGFPPMSIAAGLLTASLIKYITGRKKK